MVQINANTIGRALQYGTAAFALGSMAWNRNWTVLSKICPNVFGTVFIGSTVSVVGLRFFSRALDSVEASRVRVINSKKDDDVPPQAPSLQRSAQPYPKSSYPGHVCIVSRVAIGALLFLVGFSTTLEGFNSMRAARV